MTWRLADLPWLPPAPDDFRERCRELEDTETPIGDQVQWLANHRLDINQLTRLANVVSCASKEALRPLAPFHLGLLGSATTELIAPALIASAARHGVALETIGTPYGQAVQQALDPSSPVNAARPDAVLIAYDHYALGLHAAPHASAEHAQEMVEVAFSQIKQIADGIQSGCGAPLIVATVPAPFEPLFGSLDVCLPGSVRRLGERFNATLSESFGEAPDLILDVAGLAYAVGLEAWQDPAQWHIAKLPFAQGLVPLYADHVARLLGAMRGRSRKCLVLDLDGTLWGGTIGDDGLDGIVLGQGDPAGEAYLAVQQMALALRSRGVVLAVCSKNDDATARQPFLNHPEMLLKEDDIAVFVANWIDKASNLEAISEALNIGLETLVLLDDNPAERAQVRAALPEIAVPDLPREPSLFPRALFAAGYFESVTFSAEDRDRADAYGTNAVRVQLKRAARNLDDYLVSLDMVIGLAPFDATGRGRITQLINKTNQFNLTTRRYTEAEITTFEADGTIFTLQVRLRDCFGDNGMISTVICRQCEDKWEIDTWLMSCRVLGRRVEEAVLLELVERAHAAGIKRLSGRFVPSGRNELVRNHYRNLGFVPAERHGDDTLWSLDVSTFEARKPPMRVERPSPTAATL